MGRRLRRQHRCRRRRARPRAGAVHRQAGRHHPVRRDLERGRARRRRGGIGAALGPREDYSQHDPERRARGGADGEHLSARPLVGRCHIGKGRPRRGGKNYEKDKQPEPVHPCAHRQARRTRRRAASVPQLAPPITRIAPPESSPPMRRANASPSSIPRYRRAATRRSRGPRRCRDR